MGLKEDLAAQFPDKYWNNFHAEFTHDFFAVHIDRTLKYDELLREKFKGKKVLEIGGYPGLLLSWYQNMGCQVEAIDGPNHFPEWYRAWLRSKKITSHCHDLLAGEPAVEGYWDWAMVSDVFIHMDGYPEKFLEWLTTRVDRLCMIHYAATTNHAVPVATSGTLKNTWDQPTTANIIEYMGSKFKLKLEETIPLDPRVILIFKRG